MLLSCSNPKRDKDEIKEEKSLKITFYFENNSDTVSYGDETDLAIKVKDNEFDSLGLILGEVTDNRLVDTLGVFPFQSNGIVFFAFVPNQLGLNRLEGIVQDIKTSNGDTIVKSVPFEITYFVK